MSINKKESAEIKAKLLKQQKNTNKKIIRKGSQEMIFVLFLLSKGCVFEIKKPKRNSKTLPFVNIEKINDISNKYLFSFSQIEDKCKMNNKLDKEITTVLTMDCLIEISQQFNLQVVINKEHKAKKKVRPIFKKVTSIKYKDILLDNKKIFSIGQNVLECFVNSINDNPDKNIRFKNNDFITMLKHCSLTKETIQFINSLNDLTMENGKMEVIRLLTSKGF